MGDIHPREEESWASRIEPRGKLTFKETSKEKPRSEMEMFGSLKKKLDIPGKDKSSHY